MAATCFDSNKDLKPDLESGFKAENKKIPPSNSMDHVCTGVALGVLSAGNSALFGSLA